MNPKVFAPFTFQGTSFIPFLFAQQNLMQALSFAHVLPFPGKSRFLCAQLPSRKFFEARAVHSHTVLDFPDSFQTVLQALDKSLLLYLILPGTCA